jgi:hypothetical protein
MKIRFKMNVLSLASALLLPANTSPASHAQQSSPADLNDIQSAQSPTNAQQDKAKPPGTSNESSSATKEQQKAPNAQSQGTSNDRLFFTLPNFLTLENAGRVPPLTTRQKFAVVTRGSFDYVQYPWYAFLSGISQAEDSEPGFGQGAAGYAKRFGTSFADGTIENFMTGAILPSLLHQDPRYFQSGHGTVWHRTWYAMSRNLITRTDSSNNQFNYSEVVGGALSAAISTYSYHPRSHLFATTTPGVYRFVPSDRTVPNTAKVWATQYGYDTMTLVVKEFWPDIHRKLTHKSKPNEPAAINPKP